jgi:hypothetical protein
VSPRPAGADSGATLTPAELELRRRIFTAFAATGRPPTTLDPGDGALLRTLAEHHVVVLDAGDGILMAHPFAAHRDGARVDAGGRTWWGSCAWDGLGIVAALGLPEAIVTANEVTIETADGAPTTNALFHVAVPARRWWEDIAFT